MYKSIEIMPDPLYPGIWQCLIQHDSDYKEEAHTCRPPLIAALLRAAVAQECGIDCLNFIKRTASFGSIYTNTIK